MIGPTEALASALRRGNVAAARALLAAHPDLTVSIGEPLEGLPFDQLPIHGAAASGSRETIDLVLAAGGDINARSRWWAGGFGVLDLAEPALVYARGGDGETPVHVASTVEVARHLVEHGADLDARDVDHESTPAQYLIREHQDVVRYLVSRGCTTDILMRRRSAICRSSRAISTPIPRPSA